LNLDWCFFGARISRGCSVTWARRTYRIVRAQRLLSRRVWVGPKRHDLLRRRLHQRGQNRRHGCRQDRARGHAGEVHHSAGDPVHAAEEQLAVGCARERAAVELVAADAVSRVVVAEVIVVEVEAQGGPGRPREEVRRDDQQHDQGGTAGPFPRPERPGVRRGSDRGRIRVMLRGYRCCVCAHTRAR